MYKPKASDTTLKCFRFYTLSLLLLVFVKQITHRVVIHIKICTNWWWRIIADAGSGCGGALPCWMNRVCYSYGAAHFSRFCCFSSSTPHKCNNTEYNRWKEIADVSVSLLCRHFLYVVTQQLVLFCKGGKHTAALGLFKLTNHLCSWTWMSVVWWIFKAYLLLLWEWCYKSSDSGPSQ